MHVVSYKDNFWLTFFLIFRAIKVISRSQRLSLITLKKTLIILDISKTESNCLIIH